jgi:hypothetical protein
VILGGIPIGAALRGRGQGAAPPYGRTQAQCAETRPDERQRGAGEACEGRSGEAWVSGGSGVVRLSILSRTGSARIIGHLHQFDRKMMTSAAQTSPIAAA